MSDEKNVKLKIGLNILAFILFIFFTFISLSSFFDIKYIPPFSCLFVLYICTAVLYTFLQPLHELGHFCSARYFNNQEIYLYWSHTYYSKPYVYSSKERKFISACGAFAKILYCILLGLLCFALGYRTLPFLFKFTIIFEYIFNLSAVRSKKNNNDYYQMFHKEAFDNDKKTTNDYSDCQNNFICKQYPIILFLITVAFLILLILLKYFGIVQKNLQS